MKFTERSVPISGEFEFRAVGKVTEFTGYAAVFNQPSIPLPFIETIRPGAFARSLKSGRTHALVLDHNDSEQIVSTYSGKLRLAEDSKGLITNVPDLPGTRYANEMRAQYDAGEVRGMSFTFGKVKGGIEYSSDYSARTVSDVILGHVSVITSNTLTVAYPGTSGTVQIRALADEVKAEVDDIDELLDGIREGRALTDDEKSLLNRLAAKYTPVPEVPEAPEGRSVADWKALLTEKGVITA